MWHLDVARTFDDGVSYSLALGQVDGDADKTRILCEATDARLAEILDRQIGHEYWSWLDAEGRPLARFWAARIDEWRTESMADALTGSRLVGDSRKTK